ncbi:MAG: aminoglycoside phosphotransferase family protein, partial [Acidimicrobiales bacterium]
ARVRAEWHNIPSRVRAGIENLLGSPFVAAVKQTGGFSPGPAALVRCATVPARSSRQPGPN